MDSKITFVRHMPCNKLNTVVREKETDKCPLTDVVIPSDYNNQKKSKEKIKKYVNFKT